MTFEEFDKSLSLTTGQIISNERAVAWRAWNAAIEEAAKLVDERHDVCEPWMCGDDVRALKAKA